MKDGALNRFENQEMKLINVNFIKDVIKELDIEDKIFINDDYISFLLGNPSKTLIDFRKKNNLKIIDLSEMIDVDVSVIKKWEKGQAQMTRTSYNKLKKCMG